MARKTPWWLYVMFIAIGLVAGYLAACSSERRAISVLGIPWIVSLILVIIGVVDMVAAHQVHKYTTTEPRKRVYMKRVEPERAVMTLAISKALALAAALLIGWYGGQIIMLIPHMEASYYRKALIECCIALAACIFDLIAGIIGEHWCELPPNQGPEHPQEVRRRMQQKLAQMTPTPPASESHAKQASPQVSVPQTTMPQTSLQQLDADNDVFEVSK